MVFYPNDRIALFIDGANVYAAAREIGLDIDFKRLLDVFRKKGTLVRAIYYTAILEGPEHLRLRPLIDWLDYNGYSIVTKPAKEFKDASGRRKIKGNMDIEIAVDIMEMAEHLDHIVLFSGDGDFRALVHAVQRRGLRVSVVSTNRSQPSMAADELRRQADHFIEMEDLVPLIGRAPASGFGSENLGHEDTAQALMANAETSDITTDHRDEHTINPNLDQGGEILNIAADGA